MTPSFSLACYTLTAIPLLRFEIDEVDYEC